MSKILKNNTASNISITDTGITLLASSNYTIPPQDYSLWAASSDIVTFIGSGDVTVNDGSYDLSKADGMSLLQGNFKKLDFVDNLIDNDRLKVEILQTSPNDFLSKVSSNDFTAGYLEDKIIGTTNKITVTTLNDGSFEELQINIGSHVFDKSVDDAADIVNVPSGNISSTTVQAALNELDSEKQPLDSTLTALAAYNTNGIIAQTALDTFVGRTITGTASNISVTNGDGVAGNPTIDLVNAGTAGTYGSSSQVPVFTTDTKGRVTSVTNTSISIPSTQISDFNEAAQDAVGNILTDSSTVDFTYNDAGNTITASVIQSGVDHGSISGLGDDDHTQYLLTSGSRSMSGNLDMGTNNIVNVGTVDGVDISSHASRHLPNGLDPLTTGTPSTIGSTNQEGILNSFARQDHIHKLPDIVVTVDAIRPGNSTDLTAGNIRYSGTDLEGYVGGTWKSLTQSATSNITYSRNASVTQISTTSTSYVLMTGMTVTPAAGTYLVFGRSDITTTSNNRFLNLAIYSAGTLVADSESQSFVRTGSGFLTNSDIVNLRTDAVVTVNGSQDVQLRWKTSGGTAQAKGYSLILIKVG